MSDQHPAPPLANDSSSPPAPAWNELPQAPPPGTVLGHMADLPECGVRMCEFPAAGATPTERRFSVLLLNQPGQVKAFVNRCAHFGVPLAARPEQLIHVPGVSLTCNVHYARFRWSDGLCDRGDCEGEHLIPVALDVDADGTIRMVTGQS